MLFSRIDLGQFGMHKQVKWADFELVSSLLHLVMFCRSWQVSGMLSRSLVITNENLVIVCRSAGHTQFWPLCLIMFSRLL